MSYLEISAWANIHGREIRAWEIKLLKKLHDRARIWWQEKRKRDNS